MVVRRDVIRLIIALGSILIISEDGNENDPDDNAAGGILNKQIELVTYDTQSSSELAATNASQAIDSEGVKMIFGGSSSAVAVAVSKVCQARGVPFFGTLTYSTTVTGTEARRHTFRECNDSWMAAKAISSYLKKNYAGKKYFYITADYTWGWTTEASIRKFSRTLDKKRHKRMLTPFPGAKRQDFEKAFEEVDAIFAPTTPTPPFKIGEKSSDPLEMYLSDIFTVSANLAGIPAISIPAGLNLLENDTLFSIFPFISIRIN